MVLFLGDPPDPGERAEARKAFLTAELEDLLAVLWSITDHQLSLSPPRDTARLFDGFGLLAEFGRIEEPPARLLAALDDPRTEVQACALKALESFTAPSSQSRILPFLRHPTLGEAAVRALTNCWWGERETSASVIELLHGSSSIRARTAAARALGEWAMPEAAPHLEVALKSASSERNPDGGFRDEAVREFYASCHLALAECRKDAVARQDDVVDQLQHGRWSSLDWTAGRAFLLRRGATAQSIRKLYDAGKSRLTAEQMLKHLYCIHRLGGRLAGDERQALVRAGALSE